MKKGIFPQNIFSVPSLIRKLFLSWLITVTLEYLLLPIAYKDLTSLAGLAQMSPTRILLLTIVFFIMLLFLGNLTAERWGIALSFSVLCVTALIVNYTTAFFICCLLFVGCFTCYALLGWDHSKELSEDRTKGKPIWIGITVFLSLVFLIFVSTWTICRVLTFSTPTYDFGIFSQMFYNMKASGLPLTTVERDGLLSHFHVHVSPIYYLLLPFYWLVPTPATLQFLQAAVLASAVIPLWLIGKHHGLSPVVRTLLCTLLLFYPAYSGGTSYDIHENAFLTPLILWLFYALDKKRFGLTLLFGMLLLCVKEDAAVYCTVIALYFLLNGLLKKDSWHIWTGIILAVLSVAWFLAATGFLATVGDGVMTYRYQNFMYDDSGSLISVIVSVIMCPMKALFECVDSEKLKFIGLTLAPLLGLPFLTRRYQRYILLIPYILINLMSDYPYQHDIFFQYTYGSTACLFYMTAINVADMKTDANRVAALLAATILCFSSFAAYVLPKATPYMKRHAESNEYYDAVRQTLNVIPEDASVTATTFYTTYLSQREILYDVQYASLDHVLSTEYVALSLQYENAYKKYAVDGKNGLNNFITLLESSGYVSFAELEDVLVIYKKA